MKKYILVAVALMVVNVHAEFRVWSSKDGMQNIEAQFIQMAGNKVVLEKQDGTRIMVPMNKLCAKDNEYLASVVPPEIKIEVDRDKSTEALSDNGYSTHDRDTITVNVAVKKVSKSPCTQKFKAYLYIIAESYRGDSRVVIGKNEVSFSFDKKNSVSLNASGSVSYWDSYGGGKSGWQYEGYLVVVENDKGEMVAIDANKSSYEKKLNVIRKQAVSKVDTYSRADYERHTFDL